LFETAKREGDRCSLLSVNAVVFAWGTPCGPAPFGALLASGCSTDGGAEDTSEETTTTTGTAVVWNYVALGDSLAAGTGAHYEGYVDRYAATSQTIPVLKLALITWVGTARLVPNCSTPCATIRPGGEPLEKPTS
jgi:hypothetical protein